MATSRPKHRSPSYPALDLAAALERTEQLWTHAQWHYVPMTDAMQVWGYTPKSSAGLLTVAALKKYDLIEDQGTGNSRQVRVSDLGRSVVTDERDSPRMPGVLRDLAFRPTIHQELYDRFGVPLPPESTLIARDELRVGVNRDPCPH